MNVDIEIYVMEGTEIAGCERLTSIQRKEKYEGSYLILLLVMQVNKLTFFKHSLLNIMD